MSDSLGKRYKSDPNERVDNEAEGYPPTKKSKPGDIDMDEIVGKDHQTKTMFMIDFFADEKHVLMTTYNPRGFRWEAKKQGAAFLRKIIET